MSTTLTLSQPAELYAQSTDVAGLCKSIVIKSALDIQGRKYVRVEGWQSIATAHGCLASSRDVERVEGGYRAIGEVRRMSDGALLASAEGFVGEDEPTWFGGEVQTRQGTKMLPKRPDYAIRAMTQTRAISRACRSAFAHVVVLMDAGLSTTPAEEVPHGGFQDDHAPSPAALRKMEAEVKGSHGGAGDSWQPPANGTNSPGEHRIHFGKNGPKDGKPGLMLSELLPQSLKWYAETWPENKRADGKPFSAQDTALLNAVNDYMAILSTQGGQQKPQNAPGASGQPEGGTTSWRSVICHLGIKGAKGMALGVLDERHLAEIRAKMAEKEKLGTRNLSPADKKLIEALAEAEAAVDEIPGMYSGPSHEKLSNLLSFDKISEADFMATAHAQSWLPAEVQAFGGIPDDKAQQFCDNFADVTEGVRVYLEERK